MHKSQSINARRNSCIRPISRYGRFGSQMCHPRGAEGTYAPKGRRHLRSTDLYHLPDASGRIPHAWVKSHLTIISRLSRSNRVTRGILTSASALHVLLRCATHGSELNRASNGCASGRLYAGERESLGGLTRHKE